MNEKFVDVYPTKFGKLSIDKKLKLKKMKIADFRCIDLEYLPNTEPDVHIEVEVGLPENISEKKKLFQKIQKEGYGTLNEVLWCRSHNVISHADGGYSINKGMLPNSFMETKIDDNDEQISAKVRVSRAYLWESRMRFSRKNAFELFLEKLFITLSMLRGKIPLHCSAIEILESEKNNTSILFMGYPNTGKTVTSKKVVDTIGGSYVAEDIVFLDLNSRLIYPCMYTSREFISQKDLAAPVSEIVLLKRGGHVTSFLDFLYSINLHEFCWTNDPNIKMLFSDVSSSKRWNLGFLNEQYVSGLKRITETAHPIFVNGMTKMEWVDYISAEIRKTHSNAGSQLLKN